MGAFDDLLQKILAF